MRIDYFRIEYEPSPYRPREYEIKIRMSVDGQFQQFNTVMRTCDIVPMFDRIFDNAKEQLRRQILKGPQP
jgi:hypothetical protein